MHAHPGLQPCLGGVGPAWCCLCPCSVAPTAGPRPRTNSLISECPYESPQQEGLGTQVCADPQQLWCPPWSKAPPPAAAWTRACSAQGFLCTGPGDTACSNLGGEGAPSQLCHTPRVPMAPGPALLLHLLRTHAGTRMSKATSRLVSDSALQRALRSSVRSSECLHLTLRNAPSASAGLLSEALQTHVSKPVALERDEGPWPGALSLRSPRPPGITRWKPGPNAAVYSPACVSLEEVGAGSGITRVVSETTQMFRGKLERLGHQRDGYART